MTHMHFLWYLMGTLILINCFLIQSVMAAAIDNEEEVMGLDTESEMSNDEDPDYCPTRNPTLPTEQDQSDTEESSYECRLKRKVKSKLHSTE